MSENWSKFAAPDYARSRTIEAGDLVRPWLMAGPFKVDVSREVDGATLFEQPGRTTNGEPRYREARQEVLSLLEQSPTEGDTITCFAETSEWELLRVEEPMVHWGTYNNRNHLSTTFLTTRLRVDRAGAYRFRARQHIHNEMIFAINGAVQATSPEWDLPDPRWDDQHFEITLELEAGENVLTVAALRLARVVIGGLLLEALDGPITVSPALSDPGIDRIGYEEALLNVRIPRDSYQVGDDVRLIVAGALDVPRELEAKCTLQYRGNTIATSEIDLTTPTHHTVHGATEPGKYVLNVAFSRNDQILHRRSFDIRVSDPTPAVFGREQYGERKQRALEHTAEGQEIWAQVARYALGRYDEIDAAVVDASCDHVKGRFDCADFQVHPLLRLMFMDRDQDRLAPEVRALIRDTLLGFKYWVDEPGNDTMVTGTENHRMMFHVAQYLAGTLYPTETFTNSGLTGLQHVAKARPYLMEWLAQRGRYGYNEWHSNVYYPVSLTPVLTLLDWMPNSESPLRMLAQQTATMMCYALAADTFEGVFGTTHGRTGASSVIHPETENTAGLAWMLTGEGALNHNMGTASLAVSRFRPSPIVFDLADDRERVTFSRVRNGLPGGEGTANYIITRTPDYMMSALQAHSEGTLLKQVHTFQVTLKERAVLFFTAPNTTSESGGLRPNYWSGNSTAPRVFGEQNVAVLLFDNDEITWISHLYFERDRFDEIVEREGWLCARKEDGYVAIWSEHGYEVGRLGPYAGRELICRASRNAWIVECGRKADEGSFEAFVERIASVRPEREGDGVVYGSGSVGKIEFGWTGPATVNGEARAVSGYPLIDSPYAYGEFGKGEVTLRYGNRVEELWFNQG